MAKQLAGDRPQSSAFQLSDLAESATGQVASVTFTDLPPAVLAFFRRNFGRGKGLQKTAFFCTAVRAFLEKEGFELRADGSIGSIGD